MNPQQLQQSGIKQAQVTSQFSVGPVQYHTHNGIDSATVQAQNLNFTKFMIWGQVSLNGGEAIISNKNILPTSTIVATDTFANPLPINASCKKGTATLHDNGGGTNDPINYIIIF